MEKQRQFARRVWNTSDVEEALLKTEEFFKKVGVGTRFSDYPSVKNPQEVIDTIVKRFEERGTLLGENSDIDFRKTRQILESRK